MTTHMVLPDPHANPAHDNSRFDLAGKMLIDVKPDVLICLGDLGDLDSLSSYDKGKKSHENKRFSEDVNCVLDAQKRLFAPLEAYNKQRKVNKERQYKPHRVMLCGNHEDRIDRAVECSAELDGLLSIDKLEYDKNWDTVVPFRSSINLDGVLYSHFFISGLMGTSISGVNIAKSLIDKNHCSSTVGHSHLLDMSVATRADGHKLYGLSAGCFVDFTPSYARDSARLWWRGIVVKHNVKDGEYDLETVSLENLKVKYA